MSPIFRMNGKRIHRDKVETYWNSSEVVTVTLVSGKSETKSYANVADAEAAIRILDNLTEVDDIDGI